MSAPACTEPLLHVRGLDVCRGPIRVLQDVALTIGPEPVAIVGRNGMGKTTLCQALVGLLPVRRGSVRLAGTDIAGRRPFQIARTGIGYVPQGRRIFASLTVEEHLRLVARDGDTRWTLPRIYQAFPRLAERRSQRAATLSGGEQQMLAIARALRLDPRLLIMDEPTEGLAPAIVEELAGVLRRFSDDGGGLLLVEQNLAFAARVAATALIVVNGRIVLERPTRELAASRALQQAYLGLGATCGEPRAAEPRLGQADRFA